MVKCFVDAVTAISCYRGVGQGDISAPGNEASPPPSAPSTVSCPSYMSCTPTSRAVPHPLRPAPHFTRAPTSFVPPQNKRYGLLAGWSFCQGAALGRLVGLALAVDPRWGLGWCWGGTRGGGLL